MCRPVRKPTNGAEPGDFRRTLAELYTVALSRAKSEGNLTLDLLAHVAVLKFLKSELLGQFNQVLDRVRARVNEDSKHSLPARTHVLQERFARFQVGKKMVLRKVGRGVVPHPARPREGDSWRACGARSSATRTPACTRSFSTACCSPRKAATITSTPSTT